MGHAEAAELAMRAGEEALTGPSDTLSDRSALARRMVAQIISAAGLRGDLKDNPDLDMVVALPVINLSAQADMAVTVGAPTTGKLLVQKITDYLHLAASRCYLRDHHPIEKLEHLRDHRMIGSSPI